MRQLPAQAHIQTSGAPSVSWKFDHYYMIADGIAEQDHGGRMHAAKAEVKSEKAASYLVLLCKHFAHKLPTDYDEARGRVDFQPGICMMRASGSLLVLECRADSEPALQRVTQVIADHLVRFAWKEKLEISWAKAAVTLSDC